MSVDFSNFDFAGLQAAMAGVQQQVSTPAGRQELQNYLVNNTPSVYAPLAPAAPAPAPAPGPDPRIAELERQMREMQAQRDAEARQAREAASAFLQNVLTQYGMGSLAGQVNNLIAQWGTNTDVIALKLKDTTEYKDRFKGLLSLQSKGITDVRNEAQYIDLETNYRSVFREAGIQSFLGDAGSVAERDAIAELVGDYTVSVDEVRSRVQDAQRVVADTAPEVRDALQRFYNVSAADLVAYTLDPSRTKNRINDIANAAIVGGYAQRSGLMSDLSTAEQIGGLAQGNDISVQNITAQMTSAAGTKDSTVRLADIENSSLTDSEILQSEFDLNDQSKKKIKGLQSRERARFSGSSGITSGSLSRNNGI